MHIILDARLLLPQMTGIGRYLLDLGRGLSQVMTHDTLEIWLQSGLPRSHPAWSLESERIKVKAVDLPHMSLRSQWALPWMLSRTRCDLFHYPHFDLPFLTPGPLAATLHDLKYIARPDFFPQYGRLRRLVMLVMMRYTTRRAQRVIVVSESTRQDAIHWLGAEEARLRVIYEGVEDHFFNPLPAGQVSEVRRRYGIEAPFILFLGERRPHKNIPGLLKAFSVLTRSQPKPYRLVIAGKPYSDYREPERICAQLGLEIAVRFIDHLPDTDLPALYQSASAFALLSYYEGFGLPVLEAMASGVPVVVANTTSLPEIAGQAGMKVPPDDPLAAAEALLSVLEGGENRATCIEAGKAHARQFTWRRCAQHTLDVYHECL
jgi:glycosyltransferase involved in cell wall biosynthesis